MLHRIFSQRLGQFVIWPVVALILMSCATPETKQIPEQLAATHGYLFASLPMGTDPDVLLLKSQRDGTEVRLDARQDASGRSVGRWLPPGEYSIASWRGIDCNDYPPINVKAGRITDMGYLLEVPVGSYDFVLLPVSNSETLAQLAPAVSEFRTLLKSPQPIEWRVQTPPHPLTPESNTRRLGLIADLMMEYTRYVNSPPNNKLLRAANSMDEFLRLAKEGSPPLTTQPAILQGKGLLYGAGLGSVRVRQDNGTWSYLDTGTLAGVRAVETSGSAIFVGTEAGSIRQSVDGGAHWTEITSLGSDSAIVSMTHVSSSWYVVAVHISYSKKQGLVLPAIKRITVYRGDGAQPGGLRSIKEIVPSEDLASWYRVRGQTNGHFYYLSTTSNILRLDLDTDTWTELKTPSPTGGFFTSPKSTVLTAFRAAGIFSNLFISSDNGNTWLSRDTPPYNMDDVYFSSADSGTATRWDAHAFSATLELLHYEPKRGWVSDAESPVGCIRILRNEQLVPKYCVTSGGSILNEHAGKWNVEFASD